MMKPTKNLSWAKHYKAIVAPLCKAIFEDHPQKFTKQESYFKNTPILFSSDPSKPPKNLPYNVLTIVVESDRKLRQSDWEEESSSLHLVREISAFPLEIGKPCINERFFMDRNREKYKAKGWGTSEWRVWLALEDVDAGRKKRKKSLVAMKQEQQQPPTRVMQNNAKRQRVSTNNNNNTKFFMEKTDEHALNLLLATSALLQLSTRRMSEDRKPILDWQSTGSTWGKSNYA